MALWKLSGTGEGVQITQGQSKFLLQQEGGRDSNFNFSMPSVVTSRQRAIYYFVCYFVTLAQICLPLVGSWNREGDSPTQSHR